MRISRRHVLALTGSGLLSRVFAASLPGVGSTIPFEVDRLLDASYAGRNAENRLESPGVEIRRYVTSATVMLFSIPLISKSAVGSGYAVVEEAGNTLSIQFGAGSWPESARGLNRLGYIQEAVIEERPRFPSECAWLAFMTTSQEKNLDQAKKAVDTPGAGPAPVVPYTASQGYGQKGNFSSHVDRLEFPSRYTWRDVTTLVARAREAMSPGSRVGRQASTPRPQAAGAEQAGTFLYTVRRAMLDTRQHTSGSLVFNMKQFQLETQKEPDVTATAYFQGKNLVPVSGAVIRMNARLTEKETGEKTPFRMWYQAGAERTPPLRFEYQAKSFLRLTFEADPNAMTPPIQFAFKASRETA